MIDRPATIAPEVWRKIPPATQSTIAILIERGHIVTARINRNGSPRYSINGCRGMDAATMARRYQVD